MIPYFDAHCDTLWECRRQGQSIVENTLHLDLRRLGRYGPCAQVFAICADQGADMAAETEATVDFALAAVAAAADRVALCRSYNEIAAANAAGKIAALLSVEGAEKFDCSLAALERLYAKGVRIVHLCWNFDNALTGAAMDSGGGLTAEGREFVRAAQRLGVVLDMSHISERGFWDVLEIAEHPVLAGHSNALALSNTFPRNLTDDQFRALADCGGVAGLNLCPDFLGGTRDVEAVVDHAAHFLALGGEKAVGLGADLDGIDSLPGGISGAESMGNVYNAMLHRNWSEDTVRDIFWNNLNNFFGRAMG